MSLVYFFLKLYPVLGVSLGIVSLVLMRVFRRRGNKAWIGMILFSIFFFVTSIVWLVFRGDKNADAWFSHVMEWVNHSI